MIEFNKILNNRLKEPLVIAETAFSHEGSDEYLKKSIDAIVDAGIDTKNIAIKFQVLLDKDEYFTENNKIYDSVDQWMIARDKWLEVIKYTHNKNVSAIITVLDLKSLELVKSNQNIISAIEVHPSCLTDSNLMSEVILFLQESHMQVIIGVSGFSYKEIDYLYSKYMSRLNKDSIILIYGFQNYPTDIKSIKLDRIDFLKSKYQYNVGYADHTKYDDEMKDKMIAMVYGYGVNIFEVHYVLKYGDERLDFITAYDAVRLKNLIQMLKMFQSASVENDDTMSLDEQEYADKFRKVAVYKNEIKIGRKLSFNDILYKRSNYESNLKLGDIESVIGKKTIRNVLKEDIIKVEDFE